MRLRRRDFLVGCCQSATVAFLPAKVRGFGLTSLSESDPGTKGASGQEYHLHPHYRRARPIDAVLLKSQASLDDFVSEKYADEITALLSGWTAGLLKSPQNLSVMDDSLAPDFRGVPLRPLESRIVRPGPHLTVHSNIFKAAAENRKDAFFQELRSALSEYSTIFTADFQITEISVGTDPAAIPKLVTTAIRYELVGTGHAFHREQRVGNWQIVWQRSDSGKWQALRWMASEETQSRAIAPSFVDVAASALGGNSSYSSQLMHGSDYWRTVLDGACGIDIYGHNGVSVGDIDNDGFDDLYVCQPGGLPNRLYRNRGDGTFEDITDASGVGVIENTACALFVDVNNDGLQDLVVIRATGPMLFLNEGGGKFRQKADAFKFANPPQGTFTGAAVADYDRDGWLDIYFCLYVYYQGADQYKYPSPYFDAENGPPNFMMRNNRDGTFRDVTTEARLNQNNTRYSFCCGWNDFDQDGWPDLYVVNDFGRKNLYRNNGDGTFTDIAATAGVEDVGAGMSVCWLDYNNDGWDDLYVANMWTAAGERISNQEQFKKASSLEIKSLYRKHAMGNSLFRNKGGIAGQTAGQKAIPEFDTTTSAAGVGIGRWAWSSDSWDFDHDGLSDLYILNGMISGPSRADLNSFFWRQVVAYSPDQASPSQEYEQGWSAINELIRADGTWSGYERNIFYANDGTGTFSDVSGAVGLDYLEDGRAFAIADFDHDGRQEVFVKNRNAPQLRVLKNVIKNLPSAIAVRLRGTKSNRDAIGAVVTLETDAMRQVRSIQAGSGFLSQHSKEAFFGLGSFDSNSVPIRATIRWPSGAVQKLNDLPVNHRIWIEEGSEQIRAEAFRSAPPAENLSSSLAATSSSYIASEQLPLSAETWLLAPVDAPDFSLPVFSGRTQTLSLLRGKPLLLHFWIAAAQLSKRDLKNFEQNHRRWTSEGLQLLSVNLASSADEMTIRAIVSEFKLTFPILRGSDDVAAIYNILYRLLFDRHRELELPTSFLLNDRGEIVKVYQGPVDPDHALKDSKSIPRTNGERLVKALPFAGISDATDYSRNYLSYGSVYFQRGYMEQAAASFRIALRDDPSSAEAAYGLGSVYLDQQKTAEARERFELALTLRATYPDTLANSWNNLGLLAAREAHPDEAIKSFQKALQLSPDHSIALINLGSAYRQTKRWDDARKIYEHALAVNPNNAEANYGIGMVYAQNDNTNEAFNSLQTALKLRPAYPEALNNLGILYLRTQRRDQAVASFEECIRVAPDFDQAYLNLARIYAIEGTAEKARAVLLALLQQHPDHPQAQQMLKQIQP
jgi:tetratricopeptide (TPR) repeat protein